MYFDEFTDGFRERSKGRTITEADVVLFSTITGAHNSLFLDEEVSRKTSFGGRIAPGYLTASMATGLIYLFPSAPFEKGFVALLGSNFKAMKSVKIGDTITCETSVKEKKERKDDGIVTLHSDIFNQNSDKVMEVEHIIMVKKQ